jgi:dolichol-phosphate mannosyltransferase
MRSSVAVIIPCFNEEESIPQLLEKLTVLERELDRDYDASFVFVDDGSTDATASLLERHRGRLARATLVRHARNENLGAALRTGVRSSPPVDYLAFLDSDCTYDPGVIRALLRHLDAGADLATVSPYHPEGLVEGVPAWRLLYSKVLSRAYRLLLRSPFFTYTAMVRAVRTEKITNLLNDRNDFSFVAVFFIRAIRRNYAIVEVQATLSVRRFGVSKMRLARTIRAHLGIIAALLVRREP